MNEYSMCAILGIGAMIFVLILGMANNDRFYNTVMDIQPCEFSVQNIDFSSVDENSPLWVLKNTTGGNFHLKFPCGKFG